MAAKSFQFTMRTGPTPGKVFELTQNELYLGRDVNNDIVVNDAEVSRKHARFILQAGGYVLEDLGSTNGTFVNGQRLMGPHVLRPGELVMFGENVGLVFESSVEADATMIASPGPAATYIPATPPPYSQPAQPPPAYTGQIPQSPAEPYYEIPEEPQRPNRTLLYVGCGCLVVLACLVIAGAIAFDTLNLYCTPPFDALFPCG